MQIALLIVGVSLVSIAAIFFLTVAWLVTGLEVRSAIVGALTATALIVGGVLRRKRLTATAEGIAVFAVVLVLLDAWAIRSNDMFGAGQLDGLLYWGAALMDCTAIFLVWHIMSNLRVASVAGFTLLAPASGLLVAALTNRLDGATSTLLACLAAALATMAYRATLQTRSSWWPSHNRAAERVVLFVILVASLALAGLASWLAQPQYTWAPAWWVPLIVAVGLLHIAVLLRMRRESQPAPATAIPATIACLVVLNLVMLVPQFASRLNSPTLAVTVSTLAALAIALAVEAARRRFPTLQQRPAPARSIVTAAAVTALVLAAGSLLATVVAAAVPTIEALSYGVSGGIRTGIDAVVDPFSFPPPINGWALLTLPGVAVLAAAAWAAQKLLRTRMLSLAWCAAGTLLLAVAFATALLPIVLSYLVIAAASCVVLLLDTRGTLRVGRLRAVLLTTMIVAAVLGYFVSWATSGTWWIGSVGAILIAFFSRYLVRGSSRAVARAVLLPVAAALAVIASGIAPWALTLGRSPSITTTTFNVLGGIALSTAVLQLVVALPWRRALRPLERRTTFWLLLLPTSTFAILLLPAFAHLTSRGDAGLLFPEPLGSLGRATILLIAPIVWLVARGNPAGLRRERLLGIAGLAPVVALAASAIVTLTETNAWTTGAATGTTVRVVVIAAAALLGCAIALVIGISPPRTRTDSLRRGRSPARDRVALELGAALTFCWAGGIAAFAAPDATWLVLLLVALAFLLAAIDADGLFASRSVRRHAGWIALAVGTAALWIGLGRSGVDALELYVLPVAAALLVLAMLVWRFGPSAHAAHASAGAAVLLLAALSVAIIPLAVIPLTPASSDGGILRPIIVGGVSATLLIVASAARWTSGAVAYCAAIGLPGALGVVLIASGRIVHAYGSTRGAPWIIEVWALTACAVLVVAAFLLVRRGDGAAVALRRRASIALMVAALLLITFGEHAASGRGQPVLHIVLLTCLMSAVHALTYWLRTPPLTPTVGWLAITIAAITIVVDASRLAPTPIEIVTVPVAIALLLSGAIQLDRVPTARSWPWLGPGVAVLLVPSLVIGFTDDALWRLVALGVVAIAVFVAGLVLKLQAPFLLGGVVVLVHALVQLWPWIADAYAATQWWMWLGAGGIILIVLAARYEQRIRNIRSVVLKISALR
ncbi:SCO7613 C-terminal domain-containing membrane protein [Rathayibacter soli]|uniref:SCO7613 C-terminal domain-containing membrane protein n=1 Tax=Rathayibacter soli TaxID=3144168 RepID=UPI0027E3C802|nr:hypothetical protein [Glaciibacter superstes]